MTLVLYFFIFGVGNNGFGLGLPVIKNKLLAWHRFVHLIARPAFRLYCLVLLSWAEQHFPFCVHMSSFLCNVNVYVFTYIQLILYRLNIGVLIVRFVWEGSCLILICKAGKALLVKFKQLVNLSLRAYKINCLSLF